MANFSKGSAADMASGNPGINMGTTGSMHDVEWDAEDAYWQEQYASRLYAKADRSYAHYRPAFRFGAYATAEHHVRGWDDVEADLARGWVAARGKSQLAWEEARHAVRDA